MQIPTSYEQPEANSSSKDGKDKLPSALSKSNNSDASLVIDSQGSDYVFLIQ